MIKKYSVHYGRRNPSNGNLIDTSEHIFVKADSKYTLNEVKAMFEIDNKNLIVKEIFESNPEKEGE